MANLSQLHDTASLTSVFSQMPTIDSYISLAAEQLNDSFAWLDTLGDISYTQVSSTSTQLSIAADLSNGEDLTLSVKGSGLPVFNSFTGEWSHPTSFTVSSFAFGMPGLNNAQLSVTGAMSFGQTSSTLTLKEVKLGDNNLMATLKGSLTVKTSSTSADPQISGSITGLKYDVLKSDGGYYHLEATIKGTTTSANITALKVSEDGVGTLFEASKLNVDLAKVDTQADNFTTDVLLAGNDTITDTSGNDYIDAGAGNDKITVGGGSNTIHGGTGNDTITLTSTASNTNMINGGTGADKITATNSLGADAFVFDSLVSGTKDSITGFNAANDSLVFDLSVFTALTHLTAENVRLGAGFKTAADANDFLIFDTKGGALYYDADGAGGNAAVQVATVKGSIATVDFSNFDIL